MDDMKIAAHSLLDVIKNHSSVIVDVSDLHDPSSNWSTTDVFDVAIGLQMQCIDLTRHIVVLIGE